MLEYILDEDEEEEEEQHRQKTILVIVSDCQYRSELVKLLQNKGYRVEAAEDGFEGTRKYQQIKPDAVIINKELPTMDGILTATLIRKYSPSSRIIMTSPYPMNGKNLGFGPYKALCSNETYRLGRTLMELLEEEYERYNRYSRYAV